MQKLGKRGLQAELFKWAQMETTMEKNTQLLH